MSNKVFCPVCLVSFIIKDPLKEKDTVLCPICGAKLEIAAVSPEITARRFPQAPEAEIRDRVDNFARLRGYVFNEDKDSVIEGLLQKNEAHGDFFCPCKFDNIPENICPCLETRKNRVIKEGMCF
jgi:Ferredoxin thioredoxin reductase catalytic beta chain